VDAAERVPRFGTEVSHRKPPIITKSSASSYAPLVALGFWVHALDLRSPIRGRVQFTQPTHITDRVGALLDLVVGLLAGCEVVARASHLLPTSASGFRYPQYQLWAVVHVICVGLLQYRHVFWTDEPRMIAAGISIFHP
jgi:predicted lipase